MEEFKQRLDAINKLRIDRALAVMTPAYQRVYKLLPVFLHYNHPTLPGYISQDTPQGICLFQLNEMQKRFLNELNLGAELDIHVASSEIPAITGVYSMGSTSSIGQNADSDLDIWVCYQLSLSVVQVAQLQEKCLLLEAWAASFGVEVNFFLIHEDRFRQNQRGCLGAEDCGSTQHILLLDEFYRSVVRLAGKWILWCAVPIAAEKEDYDGYVRTLFASGQISADEWLDLGGLSTLSAEEYFGSSLWQLYKSIDSPYKAVLKTVLLEAYSWEYPNTQLLAEEIKQWVHQGEVFGFGLDTYHMMLDRVTRYLIATEDMPRLDLIRRCFYLKVCERLSETGSHVTWRYEMLSKLVSEWGWDKEHIEMLDNRANWKIGRVREAHDELLAAMMQSYRNLIRFARRNDLSVSASPQDIGVLTRKLYAAFEALPGKITLVNPLISPDLSEQDLTFIRVSSQRVNRRGWYLYNQAPKFEQIIGHQPLEYHPYLSKLIAWCYFNGLLTVETRLHVQSDDLHEGQKVDHFVRDLAKHFPIRVPPATPKELYSPCEIRDLAIIVNLEGDPTAAFKADVNLDLSKVDVLSFGQQQQCLIGSIDLLYRNSWNEVRTLHFSGELAVLDALKTILGKMHQDAERPKFVEVFCYSRHLGELISSRIRQLIAESIELRLSTPRQEQGRFKAIRVAGQTWGLFFERLSVSVQKLENAIDFYGAISNNKLNGIPLKLNTEQIDLPLVIDGIASEGIIQFFFEDTPRGFNIYILDELNRAEVYFHCEGCKDDVIRDVSRFYSSSQDRQTYGSSQVNFNLPQFYQIILNDGVMQVVPCNDVVLSIINQAVTAPKVEMVH